MTGKPSNEDKMCIQTLCEQGIRAKAIRASYPDENWSLSTLQTICRRVDETGSAVTRRAGSGRPRSARKNCLINIKTTCSDNDIKHKSGEKICYNYGYIEFFLGIGFY